MFDVVHSGPTPAVPERPRQPSVRVLVANDEADNRRHIQALLGRAPDVEVVGTAAGGGEAVAAIRHLAPDLVFLDVQMPGMGGLDVVRAVGPDTMPVVVFVTASDHCAAAAFEVGAVDFLVKPFDDERFARALVRARQVVAARRPNDDRSPPAQGDGPSPARAQAPPHSGPVRAPYPERLAVQVAGQLRPVPVADIAYITASGVYAELHIGGRRHLIRESLQALEGLLDPARFLRVHRSAIVRLDLIEAFRRVAGGDGEVRLRGGVGLRVCRVLSVRR